MIGVSNKDADAQAEIIKRLRRYRAMVANYQACQDLYEQLYSSGTQILSDMPRSQSELFETERWADKRWNQAERMKRSLDDMRDALDEVVKLIGLVDGNYNTVLVRRYLLNESYEYISEKLHCHRNTVKNWHDKAIEKIIKTL